ncbi:hypothetical protein MXD81_27070, partial [Microbacteriaceae bacterium K1510]|nr:hypothetical protein [Frankia sp. Cpl3]MCK9912847.1 hypothetical protein [Microbacteriaceae bacterium K1510]
MERTIEEIGVVSASSDDPGFLDNIRASADVQAADEELEVYVEDDPDGADGKPVTDIPQPDWNNPE